MSVESNYEPKYVELDDVPIAGPDEYSSEQKRKALYHAEGSLELDVNGGAEIKQENVVKAHKLAVMNLATSVLTGAAEEPSDVTLGDMSSDGSTIGDYSDSYQAEYERLVDKINESGVGDSSYGNFSRTVNSKNSDI